MDFIQLMGAVLMTLAVVQHYKGNIVPATILTILGSMFWGVYGNHIGSIFLTGMSATVMVISCYYCVDFLQWERRMNHLKKEQWAIWEGLLRTKDMADKPWEGAGEDNAYRCGYLDGRHEKAIEENCKIK